MTLALAKNEARKACEAKCNAVCRRVFLANVNAEPGPSGMRDGFVQTLSRVERGIDALQKWLPVWAKDKIHSMINVFGAAFYRFLSKTVCVQGHQMLAMKSQLCLPQSALPRNWDQ